MQGNGPKSPKMVPKMAFCREARDKYDKNTAKWASYGHVRDAYVVRTTYP